MWNHLETGVNKSHLLTQETILLARKKEFKIDSNRKWRKFSKEGLLKRDLTHNKFEFPMRSYWISEQENYMQIPQVYFVYFYALHWKKVRQRSTRLEVREFSERRWSIPFLKQLFVKKIKAIGKRLERRDNKKVSGWYEEGFLVYLTMLLFEMKPLPRTNFLLFFICLTLILLNRIHSPQRFYDLSDQLKMIGSCICFLYYVVGAQSV